MDKVRYYALYYNERKGVIKIKLLKPDRDSNLIRDIKRKCGDDNNVAYFNDCCYVGTDRKELKKIGNEIKDEWIRAYEYRLNKLKNIKV